MSSTTTLGELNGRWTMMFKIAVIIVPLLTLHAAWIGHEVIESGKAIAAIQANRFTGSDGLEVWKEIANIQKTIAALPPDRFEDKVQRIVDNQQLILQKLAALTALKEGASE